MSGIIEEVLGDVDDYNFSKLIRMGRPITPESENVGKTSAFTEGGSISASQATRQKMIPLD